VLPERGDVKDDPKDEGCYQLIIFDDVDSIQTHLMYGIEVIEVDESNTSKISSITSTEVKRIHRGLVLDKKINKVFNADCNAAMNILKRYSKVELDMKIMFRKLCNPIKFRNIYRFVRYVLNLVFVALESLRRGIEGTRHIWVKPANRKLKIKWLTRELFRMFQVLSNDNKRLHCYATG